MMAEYVHSAVAIVRGAILTWNADKDQADRQANLIVQRLIEAGKLKGRMSFMMPVEDK